MEEQSYGRSFRGCMNSLIHFLDLLHHLHLKKMKMMKYRRHGDGKRASRNKKRKTDLDVPSTSQHVCTEDNCFVVEDKFSTRKHPMKPSIRLSIPKWIQKEHHRKRKAPSPASRLRRMPSIHHSTRNYADNAKFEVENLDIEQNADVNKGSSSIEQAYMLCSRSKEYNFEKQCDELETEAAFIAQKDSNAKEVEKDVVLLPSKEFLAMMKLFNGNLELIRNILDDPSFIFAHYLQVKEGSNAEFKRAYSFPGLFSINHKRFVSEFYSENSFLPADMIEDSMLKMDMVDGDDEKTSEFTETNTYSEAADPSNLSKNMRKNLLNSTIFKVNKHTRKGFVKDNRKEIRNISMDAILHKIPFGRKAPENKKETKFATEKFNDEGSIHCSWNKINKHIKKNFRRSRSLNDSVLNYFQLHESISTENFNKFHERMEFAKEEDDSSARRMTTKTLRRILSFPSIKYCSSSKRTQINAPVPFLPSSPKKLTTAQTEERSEKKESEEFTTEVINLTEGLIREGSSVIMPQRQMLFDEEHIYELRKPTQVSTTGLIDQDEVSLDSFDFAASEDSECKHSLEHSTLPDINVVAELKTNEVDITRENLSSYIDFFDPSHHQIDQNVESKFKFVSEILKNLNFNCNDFLEAWYSTCLPMDPLIFNQVEDLSHELKIKDNEHDILMEHHLFFDLVNDVLVEMYKKYSCYIFPWTSRFNSRIRPMPLGNHIMEEEIWENIFWYMKSHSLLGLTLDEIEARNFMNNDRWMNILFDIEDIELKVECLILDSLLDDVVLELSLSLSSNSLSF